MPNEKPSPSDWLPEKSTTREMSQTLRLTILKLSSLLGISRGGT